MRSLEIVAVSLWRIFGRHCHSHYSLLRDVFREKKTLYSRAYASLSRRTRNENRNRNRNKGPVEPERRCPLNPHSRKSILVVALRIDGHVLRFPLLLLWLPDAARTSGNVKSSLFALVSNPPAVVLIRNPHAGRISPDPTERERAKSQIDFSLFPKIQFASRFCKRECVYACAWPPPSFYVFKACKGSGSSVQRTR